MSYKRRGRPAWMKYILPVSTALMALFILISFFNGKSPIDYFKTVTNTGPLDPRNEESLGKMSKDDLRTFLTAEIKRADSIAIELKDCRGENQFRKGIVEINNATLNMRDKPSLVSNIVLKIPNQSEVQIQYFDTKSYILNDTLGKWCKIKYAGSEGWVWGNFLKEIN